MGSKSQESKAALRTINEHLKIINHASKELKKEMKNLERQNELKLRNSIIAGMIENMRLGGASKQSIQKALPGLDEYVKFAIKGAKFRLALNQSENPQPDPAPTEETQGTPLAEIETKEVHWLWQQRIPLGKITILDGDPGMGKSLLAINLAARVSAGHPMPDDTPGTQGSVILIAPEDGEGDTLKPRLQAAGGDLSHVHLLNLVEGLDTRKMQVTDRPFSLSHDLEVLEAEIKRTGAVLVILDPLTTILGHASRDQDVREVFNPLAQLAERTNCAILVIRHLGKGASHNPLHRGAGSIGVISAARVGLIVTRHPNEENRCILATTKNNLSKTASNLAYQVTENESGTPCIQWLGEIDDTLSTLLDGAPNLSIERHKILQVLKNAESPLGPQEVAELTGQKETLVRLTLSRMHEAGEIARPYRGKYTTLHHPSLLQKSMHNAIKPADTTDTLDTSDTSDTLDKIFPHFSSVSSNGRH